ncbi:hypothetical protein RclHR1_23500002 [Rhizophagus clarus]|uniref:Uncharacterized protein n=1 Tax=Rhizophagus clarus TaxID=94130 RepID=A0A2Z6R9P4_9GLOM|nr:hypothetical protein RclHR1_23500002 [Rhizophagus clarus]
MNKANIHMALRVYLGILTNQDSLAEISSLFENKVRETVSQEISRANQNLVDSVNSNNMQIFPDADTVILPPSLNMSGTKPNKSKKAALKSIEKVYINQIIPNDKMTNVRDIFVYDVSASWSHTKIIAEFKA